MRIELLVLLVLVVLSVTIFRQARKQGRGGLLWVLLLWLFCIGGGFMFAGVALITMTETESFSTILVPPVIGMIIGAIAAIVAANRKTSPRSAQHSQETDPKNGSV